jgi:hypothetical protein
LIEIEFFQQIFGNIRNFMTVCPLRALLFHADGRTVRHK